jgi:hypothetical protein
MNNCNQKQESVSKIQQQTNTRIYDRNIPSQMLQPYLDVRPVMTKYSYLPIVDPRKATSVPLIVQPTFSPHTVFNPGNTESPWSGFASKINLESELRNQIFALQSCSQATYIPSSKSSLYKTNWENTNKVQQPFPKLFQKEQFCPVNPNPNSEKIGYALFNNSTRQQTKDLTKETKCN